ncbi:coiled-coil-helix-coiled-coil-helix domain containing 6b isoform X2 [Anoplopoma fimbria]|uniref:coiled-coil-helix-coiled-coil-helix domain containing 6b isoform X2 n=1 Tax=Anoplopoma fimbria TaxID=229290 RepID=UPI0023ECB59B|nr:coiled-coil-helix-coiled-coil-helix domain containing 6b isoform X2 [Anoplopoma fimbria]
MGGNGSTSRKVSFGLDENEKVTVIEGVKLSEEVLRRMRESEGSDSAKPPNPKPTGPSPTEVQEEIRKNFERQQAQVQEQLARLAQKERETAATTGLVGLTPALLVEKGKAHEDQEKAKILAKQLTRKEKELASISSFYKEQLEILEKKNLDNYKQTAEQYNEAATKAEAHIRPRQTASVCTELQAKVLQCYRENPQQTLHCSSLARQYMTCVQQSKSSLTNHG